MKILKFKKIDAFTKGASSGNPAGVLSLDYNEELTPDEMLRIAGELKGFVSEAIFVKN